MTGIWTSRYTDSHLTKDGLKQPNYYQPNPYRLPKTVLEYLQDAGYTLFTEIDRTSYRDPRIPETLSLDWENGTVAVDEGMRNKWLRLEPGRLAQFASPPKMRRDKLLELITNCQTKWYAHFFIRETHRPWNQPVELRNLYGMEYDGVHEWPWDAYCSRRASLEQPDALARMRREGLKRADKKVAQIFEATKDVKDVAYVIYSNHGEVYDWFRYILPHKHIDERLPFWQNMIPLVSHGNYPYEIVYANMQMWIIPGLQPKVMEGIGRLIDFAPTVLELAGVSDYFMDGESMLPHFEKGTFPERDRYAETSVGKGCLSMVRKDGYKLISTGTVGDASTKEFDPGQREIPGRELSIATQDGPLEHRLAVFDLKSDPYEYVNLIDTVQGREVLDWAIRTHKDLKGEHRGRERLPLGKIVGAQADEKKREIKKRMFGILR